MAAHSADVTWLVGDVGGTNARFGLVAPDGTLLHSAILPDRDYAEFRDAVVAYLGQCGGFPAPRIGAIAIAAAVTGDDVRMTNTSWVFSVDGLRRQLGFERLQVINDFTAQALALPHLGPGDKMTVGGGIAVEHHPIGVIGPGTGLGVSGLIWSGTRWIPLNGEGGHATLAPANEREAEVLDRLRDRFEHVSAERCISGAGLVNLYTALAAIEGVVPAPYTPPEIAGPYIAAQTPDPSTSKNDQLCWEACEMFCGMLGTMAGNLALTLGAQGGVYIAGGIVPRLGQRFAQSPFRDSFEAKGRLGDYLESIPTYVVTHSLPAFLGCAAAIRDG